MKKQKIEAFNGFTPLEITRLRKKNKENKSLTPLEVFRSGRNYKKNTPLTGLTGFTLIELLIVISIIVLLTAIVMPDYAARRRELDLKISANILAQSLRATLEKAMSAVEYQGIIPAGGYGIYLSKQGDLYQIFLFADCDNNQLYTIGDTVCQGLFPERIQGQDIELKPEVIIENLSPHLLPGHSLHIVFQAPDPVVFINGAKVIGDDEAEVTLSLRADPLETREVIINRVGLIDLE